MSRAIEAGFALFNVQLMLSQLFSSILLTKQGLAVLRPLLDIYDNERLPDTRLAHSNA